MHITTQNHAQAPATAGALPVSAASGKRSGAALGIQAGKVESGQRRADIVLSAWAAKNHAAQFLSAHDESLSRRIKGCGCRVHGGGSGAVSLLTRSQPDQKRASFTGLQSCGSAWACPICAAKRARDNAAKINLALEWGRVTGLTVEMLTLTFRHKMGDDLPVILEAMKQSLRAFRQSGGYRQANIVGSITATEASFGANGFHPHMHIIVFTRGASRLEGLRSEWLRSLSKQGLTGGAAAYQVQDASAAGNYVAGWNAGCELALGNLKTGRNGSRTPWQLLADAGEGCKRSAALWVKFALAFKGRSQVHWSKGLKAMVDQWHEENAPKTPAEPEPLPVLVRQWDGKSAAWRAASKRICALISAAELGGCLDAAEFGPTDAERWRRRRSEWQLIERRDASKKGKADE